MSPDARRYVRYTLEQGNPAKLEILVGQDQYETHWAIIMNSSFGGCQLLLFNPQPILVHQKLKVTFMTEKLTPLGTVYSRVIWAEMLEETIWKIGLQFMDEE